MTLGPAPAAPRADGAAVTPGSPQAVKRQPVDARVATQTLHRCEAPACGCGRDDRLGVLLRMAVRSRIEGPWLQRVRTKHKDQTCEDDVYVPMRKEVEDCKLRASSCSDETERKALGVTTRKKFAKMPASEKWSLDEINGRLANARRYLKARETFQATCFAGIADEGHERAVEQLQNAVETCKEKAQARAKELG